MSQPTIWFDPARLQVLLIYARKWSGKKFTLAMIAQRIHEVSGMDVSDSQLSALATGKSKNPSFLLVNALCAALGVSITFFSDPDGVDQLLAGDADLHDAAEQPPIRGFDSERLRWLFDNVKDSDGRKLNQATIVARVNDLGVELSESQLSALVRGKSTNPSFALVNALCRAFGVKMTVFSEEDGLSALQAELALMEAIKRREISYLALRASELDREELEQITNIVDLLTRKRRGAQVRAPEELPSGE